MWGLAVPKDIIESKGNPAGYWGARAIFRPSQSNPIDLLHDRQSIDGVTEELLEWLNSIGLHLLRRHVLDLNTSDNKLVHIKDGKFNIVANPNGSYGYLYIGAWFYWPDNCVYNQTTIDPNAKWSGKIPIPEIGKEIVCKINGQWRGKVVGYFVERGYQGIEVECSEIPEWKQKELERQDEDLWDGGEYTCNNKKFDKRKAGPLNKNKGFKTKKTPYRALFFGIDIAEVGRQ